MFYLKEGIKSLKGNSLLCLVFVFSLLSANSVLIHRDYIKKQWLELSHVPVNAYFNALVSGNSNVAGIKRKMKNLPGVLDVNVSGSQQLENEINHLKNSFGEKTISKLSALSYTKIKVELEQKISLKNQNLIREYLERLIGKDNITLGALKNPTQPVQKQNNIAIFKAYLEYYLLAVFLFMSLGAIFLVYKKNEQKAFIIKKFQRRTLVQAKMTGALVLATLALCLIPNLIIKGEVELLYILPALIICAFFALMSYPELAEYRVKK